MKDPEEMSIGELQMEIQRLEAIEERKRMYEAEKLAGQITCLLKQMKLMGFPAKILDASECYVDAEKVVFDDDNFYIC